MTVGLAATVPAPAFAAPTFKAPFPCGQVWKASTYAGHGDGDNAVDFNKYPGQADLGQPALASAAGTVTFRGWDSRGGGNLVKVDHGGGWVTWYAHLESFSVAASATVSVGQEIGKVGGTGSVSSNPHLHFEQRLNGASQPVRFDGSLIPVGRVPDTSAPNVTSTNCVEAANDLYFIKTTNTGTGKIEVHSASASSGYQSSLSSGKATRFAAAEAANGYFQMVGKDLYFIKTRNTPGQIEVHSASASSGYQSSLSSGKATRFPLSDGAKGYFQFRSGAHPGVR
jgi:hypothetical protein